MVTDRNRSKIGHNDKSYAYVEEDLHYLESNAIYFDMQLLTFQSYHADFNVYPTPHYF
jgi:hypothetical protein